MKRSWLLPLLVVGGGLAFAGIARASSSSGTTTGGGSMTPKQKLWAKLESIPELDTDQRFFLMLTAYGESGFNPGARNVTASEREASRRAFDGNATLAARLVNCAPRESWIQGSAGLFQRLLPYYGDDTIDIFGSCRAPSTALDPNYAIVSAIKNARALQGYASWQARPTVGTLRLGWYGPTAMSAPQDQERLNKYRRHAEAVRLPSGFVDRRLNRFPGNFAEIFARLQTAPDPTMPPAATIQGPIAPSDLPAGAPIARAVTTDEGWVTRSWWSYRDMWIRVDANTGADIWRYAVFSSPDFVIAYAELPGQTEYAASRAGAAWVDSFRGGAVA